MYADAENLISHLSGALNTADRAAFRQAAENPLAASPVCLGPGSIHRTVTSIWRDYFRPPSREDRGTTWDSGKKTPSKLITEPSRKDTRVRNRVRVVSQR